MVSAKLRNRSAPGAGDAVVDENRFVIGQIPHEPQELADHFLWRMAGQNDIGDGYGAGIDEGVARNAGFLLELDDGIEGRTRWLATHSLPQLLTDLAERQRQHEDFRDTLDRERHLGIADAIDAAIDGGDRHAELADVDLGKLGDIIGNLALAEPRQQVGMNAVEDRLHVGHRRLRIEKAALRSGFPIV